jgi:hypothetical protein
LGISTLSEHPHGANLADALVKRKVMLHFHPRTNYGGRSKPSLTRNIPLCGILVMFYMESPSFPLLSRDGAGEPGRLHIEHHSANIMRAKGTPLQGIFCLFSFARKAGLRCEAGDLPHCSTRIVPQPDSKTLFSAFNLPLDYQKSVCRRGLGVCPKRTNSSAEIRCAGGGDRRRPGTTKGSVTYVRNAAVA